MALPQPRPAGFSVAGAPVDVYTLASAGGGLALDVMTYGGVVLAVRTPDRAGALADVALGFSTPADYRTNDPRFGALIGRFANRIADARCTVDGRALRLTANDGPHCLHGGASAFEHAVWDAEPFARDGARGLVLRHTSPDGAGGFPGDLAVTVTYTVTDDDAWAVDYHATATAPTPVNLTHHTYFDLSGGDGLGDHRLTSPADRYVPTDAAGIPLAEAPQPVEGTPFDVSTGGALEKRVASGHPQVAQAGGLDHSLLIPGEGLRLAARLAHPPSGRVVTLATTEPAVQVYTGNHLDGVLGKRPYRAHAGVALETQHLPDSPNRPGFPPTVLRPGETFRSRTVHTFSVA